MSPPSPVPLISRPPLLARFVTGLQRCGLAFFVLAALLAECAALIHFCSDCLSSPPRLPVILGVGLLYAVTASFAVWLSLRLFDRCRPVVFLLGAMALQFAIQLVAIQFASPDWHPTNDAAIFSSYLRHLAENGYSPSSLAPLSDFYDYRVWTRRALPLYLPLQLLAGPRFATVSAIVQAVLVTLFLPFVWRIATLLFSRRVAAVATGLQVVFPFRWIACLELNHHLLGGLYFAMALWLLLEFFHTRRRALRIALVALAAVLYPLMRLEGGIDLVFIASVLAVIVALAAARAAPLRLLAMAALGLFVLPLAINRATVEPFLARIRDADLHHHESGAIAFMARGWVPETVGEYSYTLERIDYLTPPPWKRAVQKQLLLSQFVYNTPNVFFRLFPGKIVKYFLVGYASGAEDMLNANGVLTWAAAMKGARVAFLLLFLPLIALGAVRLAASVSSPRFIPLLIPCFLLAAAYIGTGETSPRYSIYIQPLLFVLAVLPLAERPSSVNPGPLLRGVALPAILVAAYIVLSGIAIAALPPILRPFAAADMRLATAPAGTFRLPTSPTLRPFAVDLLPQPAPDGTVWGPLSLPPAPDGDTPNAPLLLYAFPGTDTRRFRHSPLAVEILSGDHAHSFETTLPVCLPVPADAAAAPQILFRSGFTSSAPLSVGYAVRPVSSHPQSPTPRNVP